MFFFALSTAGNLTQLAEGSKQTGLFTEPLEFIVFISFLVTLTIIVGLVRYIVKKETSNTQQILSKIVNTIEETALKVAQIHDSNMSSIIIKPTLIHREDVLTEIRKIYSMIESRCGSLNCPVIPIVAREMVDAKKEMELIAKELDKFSNNALVSREETQKQLQIFYNRLNGFLDGAGSRMLDFIEVLTQREETKKKGREV